MKNDASEVDFYNLVYASFLEDESSCRQSCDSLDKAQRYLDKVLCHFDVSPAGYKALDLGCGLGFYAEALRLRGATVTALDSSEIAISAVEQLFPEVEARAGLFPEALRDMPRYDLIWSCDFSYINSMDVDFLTDQFIGPCMDMLNPGGSLLVGWRTNFDGTMGESNFANWSFEMIRLLKTKAKLEGPKTPVVQTDLASKAVLLLGKTFGRKLPIYFHRRKAEA